MSRWASLITGGAVQVCEWSRNLGVFKKYVRLGFSLVAWTLEVEKEGRETRNTQGLSNTGKASQTTANKPWDLCI